MVFLKYGPGTESDETASKHLKLNRNKKTTLLINESNCMFKLNHLIKYQSNINQNESNEWIIKYESECIKWTIKYESECIKRMIKYKSQCIKRMNNQIWIIHKQTKNKTKQHPTLTQKMRLKKKSEYLTHGLMNEKSSSWTRICCLYRCALRDWWGLDRDLALLLLLWLSVLWRWLRCWVIFDEMMRIYFYILIQQQRRKISKNGRRTIGELI